MASSAARARQAADEIDHGGVAARLRGAERQIEDGAQVILELAGDRALDGPVAGVMHARRHLVGDQPAALHEELDGEDAGVMEVPQHPPQVTGGAPLPAAADRRARASAAGRRAPCTLPHSG